MSDAEERAFYGSLEAQKRAMEDNLIVEEDDE